MAATNPYPELRLHGCARPPARRTVQRADQRGTSMVELLVAMTITAVGLLGLIGTQAVAQRAELESYQRAQAMVLLGDILDRINTNRMAATCYAITTSTSAGTPAAISGKDCGNVANSAGANSGG